MVGLPPCPKAVRCNELGDARRRRQAGFDPPAASSSRASFRFSNLGEMHYLHPVSHQKASTSAPSRCWILSDA